MFDQRKTPEQSGSERRQIDPEIFTKQLDRSLTGFNQFKANMLQESKVRDWRKHYGDELVDTLHGLLSTYTREKLETTLTPIEIHEVMRGLISCLQILRAKKESESNKAVSQTDDLIYTIEQFLQGIGLSV